MLKRLLRLIPPHKIYVEVFGGGGQMLLNKEPSDIEVYNDLDRGLYNLFRVIRDHPTEFIQRFEYLLYSRDIFRDARNLINLSGKNWCEIELIDRIDWAIYFFYWRISQGGFGGGGWGFTRKGRYMTRMWNRLKEIEALTNRLKNVYIDSVDFRRCIRNWDTEDTFFYLDPPYYDVPNYYNVPKMTHEDHEDLKNILFNIKGKWLLTYNDHPIIREWYSNHIIGVVTLTKHSRPITRQYSRPKPKFGNLIIANYRLEEKGDEGS